MLIRPTTPATAGPGDVGLASASRIARRMIEPSDQLGRYRWTIERTLGVA
jgi:hypothetical protein